MTSGERHKRLERMWREMPFNVFGITDETKFPSWQGMTAALLSFNPLLQSEFRTCIKCISTGEGRSGISLIEPFKPLRDRILAILAEAINELGLPEDEIPKPSLTLTDEQGILWFLGQCTWGVRLKVLGLLVSFAAAIFLAGIRLGMITEVRNLYVEWTSPQAAPPIIPQPTITPKIAKPIVNPQKN